MMVTLNEAALETNYELKDLASSSYNYTFLYSTVTKKSPLNFGVNPNSCYQSYIANSFIPLFFWYIIL